MTALTLDINGHCTRNSRNIEFYFPIAFYGILSLIEYFHPGLHSWNLAQELNWGIFSGIMVGVSMAMLVSRFSSVYIRTPFWALVPLFAYAVIQATYPASFDGFTPKHDNVFLKFLNIVLAPLKIMMFIVVDWIYNSGKLVYYMGRERRLVDQIDSDWLEYCAKIETAKPEALYRGDQTLSSVQPEQPV